MLLFGCITVLLLTTSAKTAHGAFLPPDYESSWTKIQATSQTSLTTLRLQHGLGEMPLLVDVQVKVTSGANRNYIFPASGCRPRDDDNSEAYGGVIYIYNEREVYVSAPTKNNDYLGRCVYTGLSPYWEGPTREDTYIAEVKVRCWKAGTLPTPDFSETEIYLEAGTSTYVARNHNIGDYPALVVSRTKLASGDSKGYYSDSVGLPVIMYKEGLKYQSNGYVAMGLSATTIRVWAPTTSRDNLFDGSDGWAFDGASVNGNLDIYAWSESSLTPNVTGSRTLGPFVASTDLHKSYTRVGTTDETFVRAWVQATDGKNNGFRFPGTGTSAYGTTAMNPPCTYGGLQYAYTDNNFRFWQPGNGAKGYLVCIPETLGGVNDQASRMGVARFSAWFLDRSRKPIKDSKCNRDDVFSTMLLLGCIALLSMATWVKTAHGAFLPPDYESHWTKIQATSGTSLTTLRLSHGLGETPLLVDVQVKVTSGANQNYIFPASGCRHRDDDQPEPYGGVIYIYNENEVYVSAPSKNNAYLGRCVYAGLSPYWEGPTREDTYIAEVKVRCWKAGTLPTPGFSETGIYIEAGTSTYVTRNHYIGDYPALVVSRTQLNTGSSKGYYSDSIGLPVVMYQEGLPYQNNGYVAMGYNATTIRVWAPTSSNDYVFDGSDGWAINGASINGNLEIYAWSESSLTPNVTGSKTLGPSVASADLQKSYTSVGTTDETFVRAWVQATDGKNNGFRFPGTGISAYETTAMALPCTYGGLQYAYTDTNFRFWQPGKNGDKGFLVCIPETLGGVNDQASRMGVAKFSVWYLGIGD